MDVVRSIALFGVAAIAEIGGAYLGWQAVREDRAWWLALLGGLALFAYGSRPAFRPIHTSGGSDPHFRRILAAYGGVFVIGSLGWGIVFDGFRPDRRDPPAPASACRRRRDHVLATT